MRGWNSTSLRTRLTWRLVAMQALVLLAFSAVIAVPIFLLISRDQGLDHFIIDDIADSIQRNATGGLALVPDDDLLEIASAYPSLWFYAVDAGQHAVRMGNVPSGIEPMFASLTRLSSANISDIGTGEAAIMRRHDSAVGSLWILTAGGPQFGFQPLLAIFGNPIFLSLLFILTLVSFSSFPGS